MEWGNEWWRDAPLSFLYQYMQGEPTDTQREIVAIVDVLSDGSTWVRAGVLGDCGLRQRRRSAGSKELIDARVEQRNLSGLETQGRFQIIIDRKEAEKARNASSNYKIEATGQGFEEGQVTGPF